MRWTTTARAAASEIYRLAMAVIRTPDQRARVFVSSTLGELAVERAAVREAVARLHLVPVLFESGARPYPAAFDHRLSRRPRSSNLLPNHN